MCVYVCRRSLEKSVEGTYSAMMAAVLSVLDANRNLDLLRKAKRDPALCDLWISMLGANRHMEYTALCVEGEGVSDALLLCYLSTFYNVLL